MARVSYAIVRLWRQNRFWADLRPAVAETACPLDCPDACCLAVTVQRERPGHLRAGVRPAPPCGAAPVQFVDVFPNTPDRKVDLFPFALESAAPMGLYRFQPDPATDRYPLVLISPASERTISSTLAELPRPVVKMLMHPDDARARGLAERDLVRIFNDLGEVQCPVTVVPSIRPGTVSLPKGLWRRSTRNGLTGTTLVADSLTDLGGGACFNDARVQVASLATA